MLSQQLLLAFQVRTAAMRALQLFVARLQRASDAIAEPPQGRLKDPEHLRAVQRCRGPLE